LQLCNHRLTGNLLLHCRAHGERFPLLAHRLACANLQEYLGIGRGAPFPQAWIKLLSQAKVPEVPEPWRESHALVLKSLYSAFSPGERDMRKRIQDYFTIAWYSDLLSVLHVNSFRVDTVPPIEFTVTDTQSSSSSVSSSGGPATWDPSGAAQGGGGAAASGVPSFLRNVDQGGQGQGQREQQGGAGGGASSAFGAQLLDQMAGMMRQEGGGSGGKDGAAGEGEEEGRGAAAAAPSGPCGSALYFLPSLLNHSCDPNLDVTWPENNANASFVARRDIDKDEELNITYTDAAAPLPARRRHLAFAYGFTCQCPRCREEEKA
jgi:hypothetical protein